MNVDEFIKKLQRMGYGVYEEEAFVNICLGNMIKTVSRETIELCQYDLTIEIVNEFNQKIRLDCVNK